MKTREEIEGHVRNSGYNQKTEGYLIIQLLLDIRDLLIRIRNKEVEEE